MNTSRTQLPLTGRQSKERESRDRTDGRSRRWRLHREKRRTELLKLAREAIAELGAGASMSEIAAQCRTSKSVFYRYFDDKDGLKRELGEYVVARMGKRMTEAVEEAGSFEETVRELVVQYLWQIENSPEVYLFVVSETAPADESPVDRFCQAVAQLLVDAHRRHGATDRHLPEVTAHYWAAGVVGLVRGAGEAWMAPRNGGSPRAGTAVAAPETAPDTSSSITSPPTAEPAPEPMSVIPDAEVPAPSPSTSPVRPTLEEFVETVTAWVVSGTRPPQPT